MDSLEQQTKTSGEKMNGLNAAQRQYDRECPFDSDVQIGSEDEQDAADRAEASRVKVELIRDDAAWLKVEVRRKEAEALREHDATVAAMKANPAFAALFDVNAWNDIL